MNDLRAACIHGRYDQHDIDDNWKWVECPGGRDITIDYEDCQDPWECCIHEPVDAAIGDTNE